jgi:hypothetical protein
MDSIKKIIPAVFFFIITSSIVPRVYAQSFSMSLNPEKHEIISRPGQVIILPYSLSNVGDPQLITLNVYALKVNGNAELGEYKKDDNAPQFAVINSAMELGKPFLMNGKSTVLFDVEITVPESAESKDYYITFVAESEGMKGNDGMSSIQLEGGVGSHILLSVTDSGQISRKAQIAQFSIPSVPTISIRGEKYYILNAYNPIPFTLTIANTGNNYFKAKGKIQSGMTNIVDLPETVILSGSQREIISRNLSTPLFPKTVFGIEKVLATIQIADAQVLYTNANIIVIPVKILLFIGFIVIIIFSAYFILKNTKNKLRNSP